MPHSPQNQKESFFFLRSILGNQPESKKINNDRTKIFQRTHFSGSLSAWRPCYGCSSSSWRRQATTPGRQTPEPRLQLALCAPSFDNSHPPPLLWVKKPNPNPGKCLKQFGGERRGDLSPDPWSEPLTLYSLSVFVSFCGAENFVGVVQGFCTKVPMLWYIYVKTGTMQILIVYTLAFEKVVQKKHIAFSLLSILVFNQKWKPKSIL